MNQELWTEVQKLGKTRHLKKNEYLLKAGELCQNGYYINSGSLVKTFLNQNGKEVIQGFYIDEVYSFVSEINSYFSGKVSAFQIKAIESCEVLEFSKTQLNYLVDNYQEFALDFYRITESSFKNLYMFSAMRLSLSAEEFLIFLYKQHPVYMQRIPDNYIAKFIGVSREMLSELKKKVIGTNFQSP